MTTKRKPRRKELGVSDEQYAAMLQAQGGGCAICGNPPKTRKLHVDHDHKTGKVRGLLCYRCNRALPNYVTPGWLVKAMLYLGYPLDEITAALKEAGPSMIVAALAAAYFLGMLTAYLLTR